MLTSNRICSRKNDFGDHCLQIKARFLKRNYPEKLIINEIKTVNFTPANSQTKKRQKEVLLVVSYHFILNNLHENVQDNILLLNMNKKFRKTFSPGPLITFQSTREFSDYLLRAKLYLLQWKTDSSKCGKWRYELYSEVTDDITFSSNVSGDTFKFNHILNCSDKCLSILWSANDVTNNTWVNLQISFVKGGITIKIMLQSLIGKSNIHSNTYINIFGVKVARAF